MCTLDEASWTAAERFAREVQSHIEPITSMPSNELRSSAVALLVATYAVYMHPLAGLHFPDSAKDFMQCSKAEFLHQTLQR